MKVCAFSMPSFRRGSQSCTWTRLAFILHTKLPSWPFGGAALLLNTAAISFIHFSAVKLSVLTFYNTKYRKASPISIKREDAATKNAWAFCLNSPKQGETGLRMIRSLNSKSELVVCRYLVVLAPNVGRNTNWRASQGEQLGELVRSLFMLYF